MRGKRRSSSCQARMRELRRVENPHESTGIAQRFPERCARLPAATHSVDDHRDKHALTRTFDQYRPERLANSSSRTMQLSSNTR
jgi:hypothetical protein